MSTPAAFVFGLGTLDTSSKKIDNLTRTYILIEREASGVISITSTCEVTGQLNVAQGTRQTVSFVDVVYDGTQAIFRDSQGEICRITVDYGTTPLHLFTGIASTSGAEQRTFRASSIFFGSFGGIVAEENKVISVFDPVAVDILGPPGCNIVDLFLCGAGGGGGGASKHNASGFKYGGGGGGGSGHRMRQLVSFDTTNPLFARVKVGSGGAGGNNGDLDATSLPTRGTDGEASKAMVMVYGPALLELSSDPVFGTRGSVPTSWAGALAGESAYDASIILRTKQVFWMNGGQGGGSGSWAGRGGAGGAGYAGGGGGAGSSFDTSLDAVGGKGTVADGKQPYLVNGRKVGGLGGLAGNGFYKANFPALVSGGNYDTTQQDGFKITGDAGITNTTLVRTIPGILTTVSGRSPGMGGSGGGPYGANYDAGYTPGMAVWPLRAPDGVLGGGGAGGTYFDACPGINWNYRTFASKGGNGYAMLVFKRTDYLVPPNSYTGAPSSIMEDMTQAPNSTVTSAYSDTADGTGIARSILNQAIYPQVIQPPIASTSAGQLGTNDRYTYLATFYMVFFRTTIRQNNIVYDPATNVLQTVYNGRNLFIENPVSFFWKVNTDAIDGTLSQTEVRDLLQLKLSGKFNNVLSYALSPSVVAPKLRVGLNNGKLVLSIEEGVLPPGTAIGLYYGSLPNGSTALGSSSITSDPSSYDGLNNRALLIFNNTNSNLTAGACSSEVTAAFQLIGGQPSS